MSVTKETNELIKSLQDQIKVLSDRITRSNERTLIVIDNTNFNLSSRKCDTSGSFRFCYNKLTQFLNNGRLLRQIRIYYSDYALNARISSEEMQKRMEREKFYDWLQYQGYWLKGCNLMESQDGTAPKEKGLDSSVTRDIERLSQQGNLDTIILVAGDADYFELVRGIQADYAIRVEVAFFAEFTAGCLKREAACFTDLTKIKDQLKRMSSSK